MFPILVTTCDVFVAEEATEEKVSVGVSGVPTKILMKLGLNPREFQPKK